MMLFSELYTMLVPLFLPDRHWIARLPVSEAREEGFRVSFALRQTLNPKLLNPRPRSALCCGHSDTLTRIGGTFVLAM